MKGTLALLVGTFIAFLLLFVCTNAKSLSQRGAKVTLTLLVGFFIPFLLLFVCTNVKSLSQEQSLKNFDCYEEQLKEVLEPYDLTLRKTRTTKDEFGVYNTFIIDLDTTTSIMVDFSNHATYYETGREHVQISYCNDEKKTIDVALFTKIVNCVSGREISEDYCKHFLADPEGNHSTHEKVDGKKIFKSESMNFWQDWNIVYSLYDDEMEELSFGGLTKYGTR